MVPPADFSDADPVLILTTTDVDFLPVVRSVLDAAGIPYLVQGEHALAQLPTGPLVGPFAGSGMAARVFVPAEHAAEARELLAADGSGVEGGEEE
jgi:Putative prokaryotic signal transducing protein